jgi:hypothetical protein
VNACDRLSGLHLHSVLAQGIEQVNSVVNNSAAKIPSYWTLHNVVHMVTTVSEKINKNCYHLGEKRERESKRMTLVMTPCAAYYLVQWQTDSNHELSIKYTNLSKRKQSIGCYTYHEILILSIIPNISSVTNVLPLFLAYCPKFTKFYAIIDLWLFVLVLCQYFLRPTLCNRQNHFQNKTGLPHENGTQFCISPKNFVST